MAKMNITESTEIENETQKDKWLKWLLETEQINTGKHIQLKDVIEDVSILQGLEGEGGLKLRLVEGFGFFNYPCDLCRQVDETGAYNLALDLPENVKLHRKLCRHVCTDCCGKLAPGLLVQREILREKFETFIKAQHDLEEYEKFCSVLKPEKLSGL